MLSVVMKGVVGDAADDRHLLADHDSRLLVVAGHDGRAGQDLGFADFLNGAKRG
jgi:hypothetical protein